MPAAIPFVVAALAPEGYALLYYTIASIGVAASQRSAAKHKQLRAAAALENDRTITIKSAVSPHQLVVGTTRVNGVLAYAEFVGDNEEYFDTITKVSFNELSAVLGVYVGDEFIDVANITSQAPTTGKYSARSVIRTEESLNATAGVINLTYTPISTAEMIVVRPVGGDQDPIPYTVTDLTGNQVTVTPADNAAITVAYNRYGPSPLKIQWALGSTSQSSTTWSGLSTPKWTSNHRLQHNAYVRALMLIDDSVFAQGDPQVSLLATGPVGVWDPRASGGAGAYINGTSNPALLAAWFRTLPKSDGGMGIPSTWIDWPSVAAAANICDETISVKKLDNSGYESVKRYECNGVLFLDRPRGELLRQILQAMAGDFPFTGGYYRCYAGAYRAPAITLTDADLVVDGDPVQFAPRVSGFDNLPNVMSGRIFDKAKNYVETGVPEITNSSYVTSDGSEEVEEYATPMVTDARQAQYLMGVEMERRRPSLTASFTVGGIGDNITLLDTFLLNLTQYPTLAGRAFEVRRWSDDLRGRHALELQEVKSNTWALDPDKFTPISQPTKPDLSYLWNVVAVSGISVASGASNAIRMDDGTVAARAAVTWSSHAQDYVRESGHVELRWRRVGDEAWVNEAPTAGSATKALIGPLVENAYYQIELRATVPTGAVSKWTPAALHIATGAVSSRWVVHGTPGMHVRGDEIIKAAGTAAWAAGVYSRYAVSGACRASFVKPDASTDVVCGLNSDPTADASYTSIDYAISMTSAGNVGIYINGTNVASPGTYAAGEAFAVEYDGTAVRFWKGVTLLHQVAADPGRTLYLDSAFHTVGGRLTNVEFAPLAPAQRGNLLDAGAWISGTSGNQGNSGGNRFNAQAAAAQSNIVLDYAPDGVLREVWECTSDGGDPNGGWASTNEVAVDHRRGYRLVVWVKQVVQASAAGTFYVGTLGNAVKDLPSEALNGNPYFLTPTRADLNFAVGRWYLAVGHVLPSTYGTSQLAMSGLWDGVTGQKVVNGVDFKWAPGAAQANHRAFMYGANNTTNKMRLWGPRFEMVDGTEPSIDALLATAKQAAGNVSALDFAAAIGLNGQYTLWTGGSDVPDGWAQWGSGTRIKETTLTRTGPNAFRVQASGSDVGKSFTHTFTNRPTAGSYLRLSIDLRIVTNTSGDKPGVLVRLYTNSGFTTYRDTVLQPPTMTTSEWQTIVKNCAVQAGEEIYRILIVAFGSWSSAPGGAWTGDAVFDSMLIDMMSPTTTNELGGGAATDVLAANIAAGTFPASSSSFGSRLLFDGTAFTPVVDCVAEVTVKLDAYVSGDTGADWDSNRSLIGVGCFAVSDLTDLGSSQWRPASGSVWTNGVKAGQGAATTRTSYTLTARYSLTAGVAYRAGCVIAGSSGEFPLVFTSNIPAAPTTNVTLIKR